MANLRVTFRDRQVGRRYRVTMEQHARRFRRAELLAAQDARDEMLRLGRANIASAGRFGRRWTEGLRGDVRRRGDVIIEMYHDVPYFPVFQFGRIIRGRPLLWIPLSHATDAHGLRARDYPGGLFRVDREGKAPLLLSLKDREPKYFGKERVTIPKKFQVLEIMRAVASQIRRFFIARLGE